MPMVALLMARMTLMTLLAVPQSQAPLVLLDPQAPQVAHVPLRRNVTSVTNVTIAGTSTPRWHDCTPNINSTRSTTLYY